MESTNTLLADRYGVPQYAGQRMEKAQFLRWESDDFFVYEYNDGLLEPTTSMKQNELYLLQRLTRQFHKTEAYQKDGELLAEVDVWLTETQMRRPDVAYFSGEQLRQIAQGEQAIPASGFHYRIFVGIRRCAARLKKTS